MIKPQEAWSLMVERVRPQPVVVLPLGECLNHVLAEGVHAPQDMPPSDRSAMDGYAVRSGDAQAVPARLRVRGEIAAGQPCDGRVERGSGYRIFTGATLPPGADAVVMQEHCSAESASAASAEEVLVRKAVAPWENVLRAGEDARQGDLLIGAGEILNPVRLGLCAATGQESLAVYRRPTVAVLPTGEELAEAGQIPQPHQIRNSNGPMLTALLRERGFRVAMNEVVTDCLELIEEKIRRALEISEAVVLCGGVSVGKYDLVPEAIRRAGAEVCLHGVAMKPGKPFLFATAPHGRCLFGLPGNPLSALTSFFEFVLPALLCMAGVAAARCRPTWRWPLAREFHSKGGRARFVTARMVNIKGTPAIEPLKSKSSADLVTGAMADGVIVLDGAVTDLPAGSTVDFRSWRSWP